MIEEELIVPISALEHHLYCPRQCALIHVDGVWLDNEHTVRGTAGHTRADSGPDRMERNRRVLRHIPLWAEKLGLSGRADAVEVDDRGVLSPVEYKMGTAHGATAHVQLCAQALCLEEMTGSSVGVGFIWYGTARRRERVVIDPNLRDMTVAAIVEIRAWMAAAKLPDAPDDSRCRACQFIDHCQPSLSAHPDAVLAYLRDEVQCDI